MARNPPDPRKSPAGRFTRRGLLMGAGAAAAGAALQRSVEQAASSESPAAAGQNSPVRVLGPEALDIACRVNGAERTFKVEPRTTLLSALRLRLDLTGAKPVCDRSQCGACTVLLDGETVYACGVLAVEVEGRQVQTVEGLGSPDALHPVQAAFCQHDAMQCGFCTPGFVVSCAWAVAQHGRGLTLEQARSATSGNLCRCGTHPHVLAAALDAAKRA